MDTITLTKQKALEFLKEGLDAEMDLILAGETDVMEALFEDYAGMFAYVANSDKDEFTFEECPMAPSEVSVR